MEKYSKEEYESTAEARSWREEKRPTKGVPLRASSGSAVNIEERSEAECDKDEPEARAGSSR